MGAFVAAPEVVAALVGEYRRIAVENREGPRQLRHASVGQAVPNKQANQVRPRLFAQLGDHFIVGQPVKFVRDLRRFGVPRGFSPMDDPEFRLNAASIAGLVQVRHRQRDLPVNARLSVRFFRQARVEHHDVNDAPAHGHGRLPEGFGTH